MPSETNNSSTKTDPNPVDVPQVDKMQKHIDLEIKEMISALTSRLNGLLRAQKVAGGGSSSNQHPHHQEDDEDQGGARIITLAGNNVGATMRKETDEKGFAPPVELPTGENEALSTYVNSNFQAINNSIMMGGSYSTNDPGVHLSISDHMEDRIASRSHHAGDSKHEGKKGKKKHKATSSDHQQTAQSE